MADGFGTGIDELEEAERNRAKFGGDFIQFLNLKDDNEFARIRFLTDANKYLFGTFHRMQGHGKNGGTFIDMVPCLQPCSICSDERSLDKEERSKTQKLIFMWTWCFEIYHRKQESDDWTPEMVGRTKLFKEVVNAVRLLRVSAFHRDGITLRYDKFGTVLDRDYDWIRKGEAGSKKPSYTLDPAGDPSEMMPLQQRWITLLPPLMEVAKRNIRSLPKVDENGNPIATDAEVGTGNKEVSRSDDEELVEFRGAGTGPEDF